MFRVKNKLNIRREEDKKYKSKIYQSGASKQGKPKLVLCSLLVPNKELIVIQFNDL